MLLIPARAKINLALEVAGRRDDGFHEIRSVIVMLDWHDLVGVTVTPARDPLATLRVTGPAVTPDLPEGGANLAHAAALEVVAMAATPVHVHVWLDKRLPSAAGLGGGSSDAAAVLRAAAILLRLPKSPVAAAAERLGSDVPALLAGGALVVAGRGERLTPLKPSAVLHMAVVVAGSSSTAATFAALTDEERRMDGRAGRVAEALAAGRHPGPADLGSALEAAAVRCNPGLGRALHRLRTAIPDGRWLLTGSGGAAFALAPTAARAASLAHRAGGLGMPARPCHTVA